MAYCGTARAYGSDATLLTVTPDGTTNESGDDRLDDLIGWAADHVLAEANFEGASSLVIGDPSTIVAIPSQELRTETDDPFRWFESPGTRVLIIRTMADQADGPWAWAVATDDGPLASVEVALSLAFTPGHNVERESIGQLVAPSRRIVIGSPESVDAWGADIDIRDGALAEARNYRENPRTWPGTVLIARVPSPGACDMSVIRRSENTNLGAITITLPTPEWVPSPMPMLRT